MSHLIKIHYAWFHLSFFFVRFSSVTLKYFFIYKFYEFFSVVDKDPTGPLKRDPHARFPTATCEISYAKWWSKGNPRFQFSHKLFFHYSETSQVTVQTGTWSEYDLQMNSDFFPVILAVNYSLNIGQKLVLCWEIIQWTGSFLI